MLLDFKVLNVLVASFFICLKSGHAISFPSSVKECPTGFEKVSNGCYMFSNYSTVSLTYNEAQKKCAEFNSNVTNENSTVVHLLTLESLGETISLYYYLKGGEFNHSFWTGAQRTFEWDWRFSFSQHKFVSLGYMSDDGIKNLNSEQNYMYLKSNGSGYEYKAGANDENYINMGYACEASVTCDDNICRNNGTCYTNSGKVLCTCEPGWTGLLCEVLIDTCDSSPCKNGGICKSAVNSYTCTCDGVYFKGDDCEEEIPDGKDDYRIITLGVFVGLLGGLIGFLCLMDFPLMLFVNKFIDIKNKAVNKHIEKKEKRVLKKNLKIEKARVAEETAKKAEMRRQAKADIKPEQFLQSEEEMLRRFKQAIIASNQNSRPKKSREASNPKQNRSPNGFTSIPPESRLSAKSKSSNAPANAEHVPSTEYVD